MKSRSNFLRTRALLAAVGAGWLFQQGCIIDPDLILQAAIQALTETAIFITDNAIVGLL